MAGKKRRRKKLKEETTEAPEVVVKDKEVQEKSKPFPSKPKKPKESKVVDIPAASEVPVLVKKTSSNDSDKPKRSQKSKPSIKKKPDKILHAYYKIIYKDPDGKSKTGKVSFGQFYDSKVGYNENLEDAVGDVMESGGAWIDDAIVPLHKIDLYIPVPESLKEKPIKTEDKQRNKDRGNESC